jgi:hypothetical protein
MFKNISSLMIKTAVLLSLSLFFTSLPLAFAGKEDPSSVGADPFEQAGSQRLDSSHEIESDPVVRELRELKAAGGIHFKCSEDTLELLHGLYFLGEISKFIYAPYQDESDAKWQVALDKESYERLKEELAADLPNE